jgi:trk system potassium uptake protein
VPTKPAKKAPAAKPIAPPASAAATSQAPSLGTWLFPAYLALIFLAYLLLRTPGAMSAGQEMGQVRGLFTAVNIATLTGLPQINNIETYQPMGQAFVLFIIVSASLITLIVGGTAMSRILRLGYSDRRIFTAALIAEAAAIVLGTFFLLFDKNRTIWQAVFMAASAFGNAGAVVGANPAASSWQTHMIVLPLAMLGGFGLCVLMELYDVLRSRKQRLSEHTAAVLGAAAWMYIGGTLLLAILNWYGGRDWRELIVTSAAANLGSRTLGMGLANLTTMSRAAIWALMLLMAVGGASGGTAGGMKTNTLLTIFRGAQRSLSGRPIGRSMGIAVASVGIYSLLVLVPFLLLLQQMPQTTADHVLFLTISAASNVGLSDQALSPDPKVAFILCATMLIGRFAPLMILWWMADTTPDAELAVG